MSKYITRVQIENGEESDYEKLDLAMSEKKFVNFYKKGDRAYGCKTESMEDVISAAYLAASSVGKQYKLTVIKEKKGYHYN